MNDYGDANLVTYCQKVQWLATSKRVQIDAWLGYVLAVQFDERVVNDRLASRCRRLLSIGIQKQYPAELPATARLHTLSPR